LIQVEPLVQLDRAALCGLALGYTSHAKYNVTKVESDRRLGFMLERVALAQPYYKRYTHLDATTLDSYEQMASLGFSFCAHADGRCVGLALAEPCHWNKSLWVRELHVAESHRRNGIGQQLVLALTAQARSAGLRTLVCETQNTNAPAMDFYQKTGFQLEGVDLSYYSNADFPDGEIALFMKKKIAP
jgi:ribosomal protein S18 acetylase RimI-like enzyme